MGLADVIKNLVMKADENAVNFLHGKKSDNTDTYKFVGLPAQDGSDKVVAEIGVSKNPRTGGFIEGFQENKNTPLNVLDNWGTPRPLNYRLGEIAGTTARGLGKIGEGVKKGLQVAGEIADSPLGRAGLVAGVVGLTGGSPLQALTYGANTGMINQANRTADQLYRNQLKGLGMDEKDVNAIRGYITDNTYKNIADSYKARWNKANLGDLAQFNPVIAKAVEQNPALSTTYIPASVANTILKGELTDAQIANLLSQVTYRKGMLGVSQQNADTNRINAGANVSKANSYERSVDHEIKSNPPRPTRKGNITHKTNAF